MELGSGIKLERHWASQDGLPHDQVARAAGGFQSQMLLLQRIFALHEVRSVVDLGCGPGLWLKTALDMGVARIQGYDVPGEETVSRAFPGEFFELRDLSQPLQIDERYDLAISTEVAEHLPEQHAQAFITNLTRCSDVVLFSAALPYQGGVGHHNENWVEYWHQLFQMEGYVCFDILRLPLWNDARIHFYYRQNALLYVNSRIAAKFEAQGLRVSDSPPSLVHPEQFILAVNRARPPRERRDLQDLQQFYAPAASVRDIGSLPSVSYAYGQEKLWWEEPGGPFETVVDVIMNQVRSTPP